MTQSTADALSDAGFRTPDGEMLRKRGTSDLTSGAKVTPAELPASDAIDDLLNVWAGVNLSGRVQVLLDVSGSMNEIVDDPNSMHDPTKLQLVIPAAQQALDLLDDVGIARLVDVHDVAERAGRMDAGADHCGSRGADERAQVRQRASPLVGIAQHGRGELDHRGVGVGLDLADLRAVAHALEQRGRAVDEAVRRAVDEDQLLLDADREVGLRTEASGTDGARRGPQEPVGHAR
jgi:hypothetical protein